MMCGFTFGEKVNVFPGEAWFHFHIMNFLAYMGIPCSISMGHCMGDMSIQLFEIGTQGCLNLSRKMVTSVGGMEDFIALLEKRSEGGTAHLVPSVPLIFLVSCSELAGFQNDILIVIIFHSWGS